MTAPVIAGACPHRCFLSELSDAIYKEHKQVFRLLGIVVSILAVSDDDHPQLVLDDGTAPVCITTPVEMLEALHVQIGKTIECIVKYDRSKQRIVADQLVWVTDAHAETLRWAQLAYHREHGHLEEKEEQAGLGYPSPCEVTAEDVYDLIQSDTLDREEEENDPSSNSSFCYETPPRGFDIKELAKLLELEVSILSPMIEELQLSGKIYQDRDGRYLPL